MKRQNVRTLSLIVTTFTYLLVGAAIFDFLEGAREKITKQEVKEEKSNYTSQFNITEEQYNKIFEHCLKAKPYHMAPAHTQWTFAGAFYFATTVISTIGYGHSTPKTNPGKIFCMFYALFGIPLCIVMFQSIGERMNTTITWILRRIKQRCGNPDRYVSQTHLLLISFSIGALVLTTGSIIFDKNEEWGYLDSFYYCFITLTTIGFGDFVALQRNNSMIDKPHYVAFSLIFILFGLTVVSSVMNLLVLRFLTMNTEDERRDELEAAAQALELKRLQGDVIRADGATKLYNPVSSRNGSLLSKSSISPAVALMSNEVEYYMKYKRNPPSYEFNCQDAAAQQAQQATGSGAQAYLNRVCVCWNYFVRLFSSPDDWKPEYMVYQPPAHMINPGGNNAVYPDPTRKISMPVSQNTASVYCVNEQRQAQNACCNCHHHHRHLHHHVQQHEVPHDQCLCQDQHAAASDIWNEFYPAMAPAQSIDETMGTSEDDLSSQWSRSEARKKRASV